MKLVLTTAPPAEAEKIARALVEERLCACAQVLPPMRSVYWWKGKVQDAQERLILLKTDEVHLERLEARLTKLHPYDVPEIVATTVPSATCSSTDVLDRLMSVGASFTSVTVMVKVSLYVRPPSLACTVTWWVAGGRAAQVTWMSSR